MVYIRAHLSIVNLYNHFKTSNEHVLQIGLISFTHMTGITTHTHTQTESIVISLLNLRHRETKLQRRTDDILLKGVQE